MRTDFSTARLHLVLLLLQGTALLYARLGFGFTQISATRDRARDSLTVSVLAEDARMSVETDTDAMSSNDASTGKFLIHWRGEKDPGYSKSFRHLEFESALAAEVDTAGTPDRKGGVPLETRLPTIRYVNALKYAGNESMTDMNIEHFNEAMQFVSFSSESVSVSKETVVRAVERCSLIHALYEIVASSEKLDDLAEKAIEHGGFSDMYKDTGSNEKSTWCFRARMYNSSEIPEEKAKGRGKRYSSRTRSMKVEKNGLSALKDLLIKFGGRVNLEEPDCKIYLFDGLEEEIAGRRLARKLLGRRVATGPKIFSIAPAERICVTNTPLEPIAAYVLCNIARITNQSKILDPYAGSCTTLLAASMIAPESETVGIEIAHNGLVNRDDIAKDFTTRNLKLPMAIICGDSTDVVVRETAKSAIENEIFDAIIADPPYGIRESVGYNENSPLEELFTSMAIDRHATDRDRMLQVGGRLVAFVPVTDEQTLEEMLPSDDLMEKAGLRYEVSREQPLNDKLSRWLVSYVSVQ